MWIENKILEEDLERIVASEFIDWDGFRDSSVFITGGTGLIGQTVINVLLYANKARNLGIRVTALVRDREKAEMLFSEQLSESKVLSFIDGSVEDLPALPHFDYMIHGASPTQSRYFVTNPVETIKAAVGGTMNMLSAAVGMKLRGFVYLSSMEVYGTPLTDEKIDESYPCNIDLSLPRNSYPESKRLCESLCASYAAEYGIPARSVRLAQTFGPGVNNNDIRVFAHFARSAVNGVDITLATAGTTKNTYLYTADAASAILTVLSKGKDGESYNAANESTYCSIREMAELVAGLYPEKGIKVICNISNDNSQYPSEAHRNLSSDKLKGLGWMAYTGLEEMYRRMIQSDFMD